MKLSILIEWDVQDAGNGKTVMGAHGYWSGTELYMSSIPFDASVPAEVKKAKDLVFNPILDKLGEKLKEGKL